MSRSLGNQLPPPVAALLDGEQLDAKAGHVFLLVTRDEAGYPHPAMLSVGEVLAVNPGRLLLALYSSSTTTRNLRARGKLTLALADGGFGYYVKAAATETAATAPDLAGLAVFEATVAEVLEDGESVARVTSGFTMTLAGDTVRTLALWEATVGALRALG
ncbi:MAG TPA: pyridoxamine 5-phosphate oxidase [Chloroflexota bacterium]